MRTLVICSLLAHLVPADSQVEESCAPPTLQSTPCKIKGFETFCKHWNNCTRAPAHSVSTPGGRCLYSRMGALKPDKSLREQTMSGSYSKVTFVAGPDNVAKLAAWHCTPEGRGYATLSVGWNNPDTLNGYWSVVFAAPCPNGKWQDLSVEFWGPEDTFKKDKTLFQTATRATRRLLGWNNAPRPVSASWPGIAMVANHVFNVTASLDVWEQTARLYSFIGGGLGSAGKVNSGNKYFLEANAFDDPDVKSGQTHVVFKEPAKLRAWLANNLGCNAFFNGDGYTYDGCYGMYPVLSASEYLLPNKKTDNWTDPTFAYKISRFVDGGHGLAISWGPAKVCDEFKTNGHKCDYKDGMILNEAWCKENYGKLPPELEAPVYGGKKELEVC